jgi:hypothetical protein
VGLLAAKHWGVPFIDVSPRVKAIQNPDQAASEAAEAPILGMVGSPARLRRSFWASYWTGICLHAEFCPISVTRTLRVGAPDEAVS